MAAARQLFKLIIDQFTGEDAGIPSVLLQGQ